MKTCKRCGNNISLLDVQFCPYCGNPIHVSSEHLSIQYIAEKEKRWYSEYDLFPSVIAHEYYRLRQLCYENKPYGVLLEIKDLYETLLKFEVLLLLAWSDKQGIPEFIESVGCELSTPRLSLGGWVYIAGKMVSFFNERNIINKPRSILKPLEILIKKYEVYKVVEWRNEHIGHGALGYGEDESFIQEIIGHINQFKNIFLSIGDFLKQQNIYTQDVPLTGHMMAREMNNKASIRVRLSDTEEEFDISPYVCLLSDRVADAPYSVYLYDNQNGRISASEMLSYPSGIRRTEKIGRFIELDSIRRNRNNRNETKKDIFSEFMTKRDTDKVNSIISKNLFHPYVKPEAAIKWIQECIECYSSGVFLLQMERGMGKSTLCDHLSSLSQSPTILESDLDVRVLHINEAISQDTDTFETAVEHLWRQSFNSEEIWVNMKPISYYRKDNDETSWDALIAYLNECQRFTHLEREKQKILMVFDGLDEISSRKIWGYLPYDDIEHLPANVFILLTSRCVDYEDIPRLKKENINNIHYTEKKIYTRTASENISFLMDYIRNLPTLKIKQDVITKLLKIADYRVLYLSMLCKLIESGMSIEVIGSYDRILESYFQQIVTLYGEKETVKLLELISIIYHYSGSLTVDR